MVSAMDRRRLDDGQRALEAVPPSTDDRKAWQAHVNQLADAVAAMQSLDDLGSVENRRAEKIVFALQERWEAAGRKLGELSGRKGDAGKSGRAGKQEEFLWAVEGSAKVQHAIAEAQVATSQEAFCGASPRLASFWGRADVDQRHTLPKCEACAQRARGMKDMSAIVECWVERDEKRGRTAIESLIEKRKRAP